MSNNFDNLSLKKFSSAQVTPTNFGFTIRLRSQQTEKVITNALSDSFFCRIDRRIGNE